MPVRSIVVVPHGALDSKAAEVTNIDEQIRKLALDMADTMYKAPGVGLAANQVGELLRLIVSMWCILTRSRKTKRRNLFL